MSQVPRPTPEFRTVSTRSMANVRTSRDDPCCRRVGLLFEPETGDWHTSCNPEGEFSSLGGAMRGGHDMPTAITRDEVRTLVARGAQLVDVMSPEEYTEDHLQGAINIFIKTLDAASTARLSRDRAVIVYCYDLQ